MQVEKVAVESLSYDPSNARKHSAKNIEAIKGSLRKFGQQKPIVVDSKGIVLAGNGTLQAARELGWQEIEIVKTELTGPEAIAYALSDNRTSELAEWDDDILGKQLQALFEDGFEIGEIGFDPDSLDELKLEGFGGGGDGSSSGEDKYTKKIEAPIYEITGEKPEISQMLDLEKSRTLIAKIDAANIPGDVKEFLRFAAYRHNVFNYQNIAEYYAHQPPEIQELMEESALVIIDFDKAIEKGFIDMTEKLMDVYESESNN